MNVPPSPVEMEQDARTPEEDTGALVLKDSLANTVIRVCIAPFPQYVPLIVELNTAVSTWNTHVSGVEGQGKPRFKGKYNEVVL